MGYSIRALDDIPEVHPVAVVARFWQAIRREDGAPDWSAFDPIDHPQVLRWIMLLRPEPDGTLRYVVCGTACVDVFGLSYQGKVFGEGLTPEATEIRRREFDTAVADHTPILSETELPIPGREHVRVYRGVFPFLSHDGVLQRIMVVLAPVDVRAA